MDLPVPLPTAKYFLLADYVEVTHLNKVILVGIFDRYFVKPNNDGKIVISIGFLAAEFMSSLANGTNPEFELVCVSEDEDIVQSGQPFTLPFSPAGPGRPFRAHFITRVAGLVFPKYGEYSWVMKFQGREVARCTFELHPLPE